MATSDVSVLRRAGVATPRGLSIYSSGRLGEAQRMENRARRDITRIRPDNPNAPAIRKQLQRRIAVANQIRAEVKQVQEAFRRQEEFRAGIQQQQDVAAARAATTEETKQSLRQELLLRARPRGTGATGAAPWQPRAPGPRR